MVWRTTFITLSTCFLLGTTFTHWIADHNVLWKTPLTADALVQSIQYYSLLSSAPSWLYAVYLSVGAIGVASVIGRVVKGYKGNSGEILFDGGSVVLLLGIAYNQINEALPTITLFPSPLPANLEKDPIYPTLSTAARDLANDNVITAVMLTGVMLIQAGRYYAKRPSSPPSYEATQATPPDDPPSPIANRSATPFRELTQDEAMELNGSGGSGGSVKRKSRRRSEKA